jgi:magnesium-transporting ATPase (P-type)
MFSVAVWFWDYYRYYAGVILVLSVISIIVTLYQTIVNNNQIRKMALYTCEIGLMQADKTIQIVDSAELLPGDIVEVPQG